MKKTTRLLLLMAAMATICWAACTYKKEATAYPATGIACDTSNIRYSVEVTGVLSTNCYPCHASAVAAGSGGGNKLDSYTNLKAYASSGLLLNVIMHTPGYDQMPKNASKLSDCDIAKIRTWIRNGMLNN